MVSAGVGRSCSTAAGAATAALSVGSSLGVRSVLAWFRSLRKQSRGNAVKN